jgi:hypothetical protein
LIRVCCFFRNLVHAYSFLTRKPKHNISVKKSQSPIICSGG